MNAALSIMVGGPEDLFDEVKPVFEVMGKTVTLCGGNGAGQTVKACNQIQVALNFIGMAEAFVLGAKAGVDPAIPDRRHLYQEESQRESDSRPARSPP